MRREISVESGDPFVQDWSWEFLQIIFWIILNNEFTKKKNYNTKIEFWPKLDASNPTLWFIKCPTFINRVRNDDKTFDESFKQVTQIAKLMFNRLLAGLTLR